MITVDMILQAYEITGLKPVREDYLEKIGDTPCGCPVGALMRCLNPELPYGWYPNPMGVWDLLDRELVGIIDGFDGIGPTAGTSQYMRYPEDPGYMQGLLTGQNVYEALVRKHGVVPTADEFRDSQSRDDFDFYEDWSDPDGDW